MKWNNKSTLRGLIITLKQGAIVRVNNGEMRIQLIETKGQYARIAFEASKEISIFREEERNTLREGEQDSD